DTRLRRLLVLKLQPALLDDLVEEITTNRLRCRFIGFSDVRRIRRQPHLAVALGVAAIRPASALASLWRISLTQCVPRLWQPCVVQFLHRRRLDAALIQPLSRLAQCGRRRAQSGRDLRVALALTREAFVFAAGDELFEPASGSHLSRSLAISSCARR